MYIIREILKKSIDDPKTLDFINEVEKLTSLVLDGYSMEYIKESATYIRKKFYKMDDKNITLFFKNVCENLANIYQILHDKNINTKELDKATSQLYNVLNKLEKEDSNDDATQN